MRAGLQSVFGSWRKSAAGAVALAAVLGAFGLALADLPAGFDARTPIGPYLNGIISQPSNPQMPMLLSQTGAFSNVVTRTPTPGLIPYDLNSPLWTDGSIKSRFLALPYDGTPGSPGSPQVGNAEDDFWTFPAGTVIVKNFDLLVDERPGAANPVRRLETRLLVRYVNASGAQSIKGATYRWNEDYSEATRVDFDTTAPIAITQADGSTRQQPWLFPGPGTCLVCHNQSAGMVLGPKTAQLNKDFDYGQYLAGGRVDNQLHTWSKLGMLATPLPDTASYPNLPKMVDVADTSATMENRVRSYIASNCSFCHRRVLAAGELDGPGPKYDMRYETPNAATKLFDPDFRGPEYVGFTRDSLAASMLYTRDKAFPGEFPGPMPPLGRNVPDQRVLDLYDQWVNAEYDVTLASATSASQVLLTFNKALEPVSAGTAANYAIGGLTVLQATPGIGPQANTVTLTTSIQTPATTYTVTINRVREQAAPQNPIFPNTTINFQSASVPGAPSITSAAPGNGSITLTWSAPLADGGLPISGYQVICNAGAVSVSAAGSPATVTGLANGTVYVCSVSASNALGSGPASAPVSVTPRTLPAAPTITSIVGASGSASISFNAGADGGATISGFEATCTSTVPAATFTASGGTSPLLVTGLANGTEYACTVTATNAAGTSSPSTPVTVVPQVVPVLQGVKSVKSHSGNLHGIDIGLAAAIDGDVTVEPRNIGSGHKLVFTFDIPVTTITGVTIVDINGATAGSAAYSFDGAEVSVVLNGVADNQRVTVTLIGVNGNHAYPVSMGFLLGDVTGSRSVNSTDILASKVRRTDTIDTSNFWLDVDTSGAIDAKDTAIIKAKTGRRL